MIIVGIDAGQKGAIAILNTETDEMTVEDIQLCEDRTLDSEWLFVRLSDLKPAIVAVEDTFRGKSIVRFVGEINAICKIIGLDLRIIQVARWKKKMLGYNTKDKKVSIQQCQKLRPEVNLIRKRALNSDRAEAVLICLYIFQLV